MSHFSEGQTHQLMEALQAADYTPEHVTMLGQYKKLGDFRLVLEGQAEIVLVREPELVPEPTPDTTIHVDRSIRPVYPDWADPKWINSPEF
ncbi:MAG: hypothetical protein Q7K44_00995, partial [Candidatus Liptonbacteria bacterium]|nr:hypothetical protein [Candidatus Liptonbacteria bacterium]